MKVTCEHCGADFNSDALTDWLLEGKGCPECGKGPNLRMEVADEVS